jgi:hypothetical protein
LEQMSTKRDRDDLHHRACRAAYEQGLIGDDDRKVFIYREMIDGIEVPCLKCVVAREPDPSNTTVRADTWSIERSTRNDLDAIVSLGVKVTLLLYCEIVNDVVEVRYHTDSSKSGVDLRLQYNKYRNEYYWVVELKVVDGRRRRKLEATMKVWAGKGRPM